MRRGSNRRPIASRLQDSGLSIKAASSRTASGNPASSAIPIRNSNPAHDVDGASVGLESSDGDSPRSGRDANAAGGCGGGVDRWVVAVVFLGLVDRWVVAVVFLGLVDRWVVAVVFLGLVDRWVVAVVRLGPFAHQGGRLSDTDADRAQAGLGDLSDRSDQRSRRYCLVGRWCAGSSLAEGSCTNVAATAASCRGASARRSSEGSTSATVSSAQHSAVELSIRTRAGRDRRRKRRSDGQQLGSPGRHGQRSSDRIGPRRRCGMGRGVHRVTGWL